MSHTCFSFGVEVTHLLERSAQLIQTLEQLNLSLREGKNVDISPRVREDIGGLRGQLEGLLQGKKWRNSVDRIWSFGPRRSAQREMTALFVNRKWGIIKKKTLIGCVHFSDCQFKYFLI